jgi:vaccinia related kinase
MDILEYVHAQGYVHADIKGSNLLVGEAHGEDDRVFLVDFGLATRYQIEGVHKEFKPDLRKAHDGTLEYTSRDAHQGGK